VTATVFSQRLGFMFVIHLQCCVNCVAGGVAGTCKTSFPRVYTYTIYSFSFLSFLLFFTFVVQVYSQNRLH